MEKIDLEIVFAKITPNLNSYKANGAPTAASSWCYSFDL